MMTFNCCLDLIRSGRLARFMLIGLVLVALSGQCGGGGTGEVYLNQTSSSPASVRTQPIEIDNCANKETNTVVLERSLDISIEGGVGVDIKALEANLGAKYARGQASKIELAAGPGTNMEYLVEWTEEAFFGEITVDGQSGKAKYTVSVETPNQKGAVDRGCITGGYSLVRWDEAPSPITLYMDVDSGSIVIDPSGDATWTLAIRERGEFPSPQPGITCKGRFYAGSQQLEGGPGGNAADWTFDMSGFSHDLWMAFCGWDVGGENDPFMLYPRELGGGERVLEMKNSRGTLIWEK